MPPAAAREPCRIVRPDRAPRAAAVGFTLIEILVVIAIVALLIAILLPALGKARQAAREAVCLSNHRQLNAAWTLYTNDYHTFPFPAGIQNTYGLRTGWGGANWFSSGTVPGWNITADRPVNPYVAESSRLDYRVAVFKCPLDDGDRGWATGADLLSTLTAGSASGEATVFGVAGNSYECNEWMYCKPGVVTGWQNPVNFRSALSPKDVEVSPSRFVMLFDSAPQNWLVSDNATRVYFDLGGGWWHGPERSPLSFLDGSVRIERSGLLVCDRYSFHLAPLKPSVANAGWHWPDHQ